MLPVNELCAENSVRGVPVEPPVCGELPNNIVRGELVEPPVCGELPNNTVRDEPVEPPVCGELPNNTVRGEPEPVLSPSTLLRTGLSKGTMHGSHPLRSW